MNTKHDYGNSCELFIVCSNPFCYNVVSDWFCCPKCGKKYCIECRDNHKCKRKKNDQ